MNIGELEHRLNSSGVNKDKFSLKGGVPLASEGIVLFHEGQKWVVKHFERGSWYTIGTFEEESEACWKVFELLNDPFYKR